MSTQHPIGKTRPSAIALQAFVAPTFLRISQIGTMQITRMQAQISDPKKALRTCIASGIRQLSTAQPAVTPSKNVPVETSVTAVAIPAIRLLTFNIKGRQFATERTYAASPQVGNALSTRGRLRHGRSRPPLPRFWQSGSEALDGPNATRVSKELRSLLLHKTALDRRRWFASGRATGQTPAFESEWCAQIVNQRLPESLRLSDAAFHIELIALVAMRDDEIGKSIGQFIDRLGGMQHITIPLGCALDFKPVGSLTRLQRVRKCYTVLNIYFFD